MTWWPWLVPAALAVAAAGPGLQLLGRRRWAAGSQALLGQLDASRTGSTGPTHYDAAELAGLPAPVQRYFRATLRDGQPMLRSARIQMAGRINLSSNGQRWRPFSAVQQVQLQRPGFVWSAQVAMLPGLPVQVVDSYIAGQGRLQAALLGLVDVAHQAGAGEIARGELMRWFAEAAWYPTALLPSQGVQWQAVDAHAGQATLTDGPLTLQLLFQFGEDGLMRAARAEARGATVGKTTVMLPWEGRWSDHRPHNGMTLPMTGEAAWLRPDGRRPYFCGTVTALQHESAP